MLLAVCHSEESGWVDVKDLEMLSDLRADSANLLWAEADVSSLTEDDIRTIAQEFDLHPLAVDDARNTRQRPKVEIFEDHHLFVVFHQLDEHAGQLEAIQIACFVGEGYVLTLHGGADRTIREVRRRWEADHEWAARRGRTYLMHKLLDAVVDDYQAVADRLEQEIEDVEEETLESIELPPRSPQRGPGAAAQRQLYSIKQRLARLRRYAMPTARVLETVLTPGRSPLFSEETALLFRDVHDHLLRINDQIRNVDELSDAVLELRRGEQAASLNETNKKLTAWAAIIAVPTLISSMYGMNFRLVPRDGTLFGFTFAVAAMASAGLILYAFFKRKGWL